MSKRIFLTMDLDWASEDVIEEALPSFDEFALPLTVFQTHFSPNVQARAKSYPTELEWHPNFLEGSSQGADSEKIDFYLQSIPSERKIVRCHLYYEPDSLPIFLNKNGIGATSDDLSLLSHKSSYLKDGHQEVPLFFEDGCYIKGGHPLDIRHVLSFMEEEGDYVFLFHPIHLAFNSIGYSLTRELKDNLPRETYWKLSHEFISSRKAKGYGMRRFANDLIRAFRSQGYGFYLLKETLHD